MFDRKNLIIFICGGGHLFLYLSPYNSNFRYFEIKSLVPRTLNLQGSMESQFCLQESLRVISSLMKAGEKLPLQVEEYFTDCLLALLEFFCQGIREVDLR